MFVKAAAFPRRGLQHTEDGAFHMLARDIHSPELLRQLLDYNPETGRLTWRPRDISWFAHCKQPETRWLSWRSRHEGRFADEHITQGGYRACSLLHVRTQAHRIAWAIVHGEWPEMFIDHIDQNRKYNALSNLRVVDQLVNAKNQRRSVRNTSGHTGVYWCKATGLWKAQIASHRKMRSLGRYARIEDAVAARKAAEQRLGFHPNHGSGG